MGKSWFEGHVKCGKLEVVARPMANLMDGLKNLALNKEKGGRNYSRLFFVDQPVRTRARRRTNSQSLLLRASVDFINSSIASVVSNDSNLWYSCVESFSSANNSYDEINDIDQEVFGDESFSRPCHSLGRRVVDVHMPVIEGTVRVKEVLEGKEREMDTTHESGVSEEDEKGWLKCAYVNARSIGKKMSTIKAIMETDAIEVIVLTETHLREVHQAPEVEGYKHFGCVRGGGKASRGVSIYIKEGFNARKIDMAHIGSNHSIWISVSGGREKLAIGGIYIPPEGEHFTNEELEGVYDILSRQITYLKAIGMEIFLVGDFNAHIGNGVNGIRGNRKEVNKSGKLLAELVDTDNVVLENRDGMVEGMWTRHPTNPRESPTLIDYLISDCTRTWLSEFRIDTERSKWEESDHNWIEFVINYAKLKQVEIKREENLPFKTRNIDMGQWQEIFAVLEEKVNEIPAEGDGIPIGANDMYHIIKRILHETLEETVGRIKVKRRKINLSWYGLKTKRLMAKRRIIKAEKARRKRRGIRYVKEEEDIKRVSDQIKATQTQEWDFNMTEVGKKTAGNSYQAMDYFYEMMNKVNGKKVNEEVIMVDNNNVPLLNDTQLIAELTEFWNTIFTPTKYPQGEVSWGDITLDDSQRERIMRKIEEEEICVAVKKFKAKSSAGNTNLPTMVFGETLEWIGPLILRWGNKILETLEVPRQMAVSRTTMLHKKAAKNRIPNHRTLSVGCNLCKIFLRIINNRIGEICEEAGIFGELQNGFRKKRRAQDNLFVLDTLLYKTKWSELKKEDKNKELFIALLDITKAYDRVNRELLWGKMSKMGFPGKLITLLQNTYKNPVSIIKFQGVETGELKMNVGLKQGCVMSPNLFSIFISDLGQILEKSNLGITIGTVNISALLFADDLMLSANKNGMVELLRLVGEWAERNAVEFAPNKSFMIPIDSVVNDTREWRLVDNGPRLEETNQGTYLGVTFQKNINFYKPQRERMVNKANSFQGIMSALCNKTSNPARFAKKYWPTYAISSMLYGTEIIEMDDEIIRKLNVAQNSMFRRVMCMPPWAKTLYMAGAMQIPYIEYEICKMKLNYYFYLNSVPKERFIYHALQEQEKWKMEYDEMLDRKEFIGNETGRRGYPWIIACVRLCNNLEMGWGINNKKSNKRAIWNQWVDYYRRELGKSPSLEWCRQDMAPTFRDDLARDTGVNWWHRARIKALWPGGGEKRNCELCDEIGGKSIVHILCQCPAIVFQKRPWEIVARCLLEGEEDKTKETDEDWVAWLLQSEREMSIKKVVGKMVKEKYSQYEDAKQKIRIGGRN
jgi:hypothetical protein